MSSPLKSPEGVWWNWAVSRQERTWLGLALLWCVILFGWMIGWRQLGAQNPVGPTTRISPDRYRAEVEAYEKRARRTDQGLVPPGVDVYVGAQQWTWNGLPVVLQAGKRYRLHLSSYDVQHGFGLHRDARTIEQFNLQVLPGYEWVVPIDFKHPGVYDVQCNEFCGVGHRTMHGQIIVE